MSDSLKGHLLVASPELEDPNFARTVVAILEHSEAGAMGLVVNRPLNMTIAEAWEQVSGGRCNRSDQLYYGGPCEGPLMVLHGHEPAAQERVCPGVYVSTDRDAVASLIELADQAMKFVVGYAGWTPGQLEMEIETGSWMTVEARAEHIFDEEGRVWNELVERAGPRIQPAGLRPEMIPDDPSVN